MPDVEDLITFTEAAEDKDCGRNTLYRAVDDGRLNAVKVGDRKMLVMDEKYRQFQPKWTGARARRDQGEETSNSE